MTDITWCKKQRKGISLISPNGNLSSAYMKESLYNLVQMGKVDGKLKVVLDYYACYSALYSLLIKVGIKCEIHDCTLALVQYIKPLEKFSSFLLDLKQKRIDVQYYLKEELVDEKTVKTFINAVQNVSDVELQEVKEVCHES